MLAAQSHGYSHTHRQHTGGWSGRGCISHLCGSQPVESRHQRAFLRLPALIKSVSRCFDDDLRRRRWSRMFSFKAAPGEEKKHTQNGLNVFRINSMNSLHRDRRGKRAPPLTSTSSVCDFRSEPSCSVALLKTSVGGGKGWSKIKTCHTNWEFSNRTLKN